eukprot:CAMPEP_0201979110 /NCGR_PEP_ID=MMETSP0904-20121228/66323_1 /ASSEMBLY_ACC=CAM_ASM_000553 /TAXON_ID=420261 /ORGANISM="Thalassiosira antarctica, Strain CCMP982" /LENGTH=111 /DNA_ID=CAMNT_0048531013 /DNA_START=177 /DNA_END=512 /DNA_ORIENTATION=-
MDVESDESHSQNVVLELRAVMDITVVLLLCVEDFLRKWDLLEEGILDRDAGGAEVVVVLVLFFFIIPPLAVRGGTITGNLRKDFSLFPPPPCQLARACGMVLFEDRRRSLV